MLRPFLDASVVFLDTAPIVYYIEEHPRLGKLVEPLIEAIDDGQKRGLSSHLTILEVLIRPYRVGQVAIANRYRDLLLRGSLQIVPFAPDVADEAAQIRAQYRHIRTPDAIQLASAKISGADLFVTNDRRLRAFSDLEVLILRDYIKR
jgi:predicted nucleic acid-binding protein